MSTTCFKKACAVQFWCSFRKSKGKRFFNNARSLLNVDPAGLAHRHGRQLVGRSPTFACLDISYHAANEWRTSICTAPISSPLSPLTSGRDSDFGSISGGCQVTGKRTTCYYCLLLAADDPDENILAAIIDEQLLTVQVERCSYLPLFRWPWQSVA